MKVWFNIIITRKYLMISAWVDHFFWYSLYAYKEDKVSMEFAINNPQIATKKTDTFASHSKWHASILSFSVDKLFKWGSAKDLWTIRGHLLLSLHASWRLHSISVFFKRTHFSFSSWEATQKAVDNCCPYLLKPNNYWAGRSFAVEDFWHVGISPWRVISSFRRSFIGTIDPKTIEVCLLTSCQTFPSV